MIFKQWINFKLRIWNLLKFRLIWDFWNITGNKQSLKIVKIQNPTLENIKLLFSSILISQYLLILLKCVPSCSNKSTWPKLPSCIFLPTMQFVNRLKLIHVWNLTNHWTFASSTNITSKFIQMNINNSTRGNTLKMKWF